MSLYSIRSFILSLGEIQELGKRFNCLFLWWAVILFTLTMIYSQAWWRRTVARKSTHPGRKCAIKLTAGASTAAAVLGDHYLRLACLSRRIDRCARRYPTAGCARFPSVCGQARHVPSIKQSYINDDSRVIAPAVDKLTSTNETTGASFH